MRRFSFFLSLPALMLGPLLVWAPACGDDKAGATNTAPSDGATNPGAQAKCVPATDADHQAFQQKVAGILGGPVTVDPCSKSMLATYKDEGFKAVTDEVVARSLDANMVAKIGTSFQDKLAGASVQRQTAFTTHLKLFLEQVYSDQEVYPKDAPDMVTAHKPLNITFDQYLAFATEVVVPSLKKVGVSDEHVNKCFVPPVLAEATVRSMVFCQ